MEIKILTANKTIKAKLNNTETAKIIYNTLPLTSKVNKWGDEIYFSIPVKIEKLQHFQTLVEMVRINQLLTETDAPWLSPTTGLTNEPANVLLTVKKIAEIKKMTQEETANNIFMNYQNIFE